MEMETDLVLFKKNGKQHKQFDWTALEPEAFGLK
jgi:hypothetical protein